MWRLHILQTMAYLVEKLCWTCILVCGLTKHVWCVDQRWNLLYNGDEAWQLNFALIFSLNIVKSVLPYCTQCWPHLLSVPTFVCILLMVLIHFLQCSFYGLLHAKCSKLQFSRNIGCLSAWHSGEINFVIISTVRLLSYVHSGLMVKFIVRLHCQFYEGRSKSS